MLLKRTVQGLLVAFLFTTITQRAMALCDPSLAGQVAMAQANVEMIKSNINGLQEQIDGKMNEINRISGQIDVISDQIAGLYFDDPRREFLISEVQTLLNRQNQDWTAIAQLSATKLQAQLALAIAQKNLADLLAQLALNMCTNPPMPGMPGL